MKFHRVLAIPVLVATAALTVTACGSDDKSSSDTVVRIGTTDKDKAWDVFEQRAKDKGITLKITNFSDYKQPNLALSQKQIDVNLFQHLQFLGAYNVANKDTLTPIGATYIVPLGLYSKKHKALADLPQGAEIAIPNDPTNQARALFVLQAAGLLKLSGSSSAPTAADVDKGASKVKVTTVDAAQTALSLASVDGAVINNTFLDRSGIDPNSALYKDDPKNPSAEPYINALVTRAEDKNNPKLLQLVELWHDPEVQRAHAEVTKNTAVDVRRTGPELEQILQRVQQTIRDGK
ncbi:putative ABC transporter substrate-binding protein [Nocardia brasiliensis NBRC 14402]|uniref:MetQ/NlpA family ABC transporter substrate-binding protein n=1 Tax=Nocardia brasiliensis TaxID=37326 RepID=UPI0002E1889C|nr:MetQ/NlpA family ABC transporter substrate-binding protein [Nocardia brasiliensis]ASF06562.1 methionine ABC transporter substrate-binding protein [Nocardia brasiliensis]GAJ83504.1 putative ABC transporter substrate-binding protein [Nocardia brasiliensis NBRC 14402]SUB48299.1 D-methionine-binding lipoprotein metQ precursor [Nocardia brasiliensis]